MSDLPFLSVDCNRRVAKRIVDILGALAGLVIVFPVALLVAVAICVDSSGPILFAQERIGQNGRRTTVYKFRKFYTSGEPGPPLTLASDQRMTRIGCLIERTKLDELPQLWNVLRGDLSLVGPRPETYEFASCFDSAYCRVLAYKPGIFGPNQVLFRNESHLYPMDSDPELFYRQVLFPLKARVDLAYFPHATLAEDIGWIVRGVLAIVFGMRGLEPEGDWIGSVEAWIENLHKRRRAAMVEDFQLDRKTP